MTKIAVITPVFNSEKYITENINSVALSVTDNNFTVEHILVDDCSTDSTWEIVQSLNSPLLKTFRLEKNSGVSAARNFAVNQTDAGLIYCLDSDDVIFQNSLKSLLKFYRDMNSVWVYGDFIKGDESLSYLSGQDYYGHQFENPANLLTSIFIGEHFFQQSSFYSRQLFSASGGFDPGLRVCEDLDLFVRFTLSGYVPHYLPCPLYIHRSHDRNLSKVSGRENNPSAHKNDLLILYSKYETRLKSVLSSAQLQKINDFLAPMS
jgi:glycosyltransferase involved in cell wall biosynthesis